MTKAKHVTTMEYLEGMRAFTSGKERFSGYGDKVRRARWFAGFDNASESATCVETRLRKMIEGGEKGIARVCDGQIISGFFAVDGIAIAYIASDRSEAHTISRQFFDDVVSQSNVQWEFIEVGLTGPDWEPDESNRYYAQLGKSYAFGATEDDAITAVLKAHLPEESTVKEVIPFRVSCNHVNARWTLDNARVDVKTNDRGASWYCYIPEFGCSKSFSKPEYAIHSLLADNAATAVYVERESTPAADQPESGFKFHRFANLDEMKAFALSIVKDDEGGKVFAESGIYTDNNGLSFRAQVAIVTDSVIHVLRWNAFSDQPDIEHMGKRARVEAHDSADWFTDQIQSEINAFYNTPAVASLDDIPTGRAVELFPGCVAMRLGSPDDVPAMVDLIGAATGEPITRESAPQTVDITPNWKGTLPLLLAGIENGTATGRAMARAELQRMAQIADSAQTVIDTIVAYNAKLDDPHNDGSGRDARPPTGDDYNELARLIRLALK